MLDTRTQHFGLLPPYFALFSIDPYGRSLDISKCIAADRFSVLLPPTACACLLLMRAGERLRAATYPSVGTGTTPSAYWVFPVRSAFVKGSQARRPARLGSSVHYLLLAEEEDVEMAQDRGEIEL